MLHLGYINGKNFWAQTQSWPGFGPKITIKLGSGEELSESAAKKVEKYLILSRQGRGGKLTVKFNQEAFNETAKFFGLFVLVSNKAQDCFEALEDYRLREKTEEAFGIYKEYCDGRKPRVWTGDRLRGRQFVQFIPEFDSGF